MREYKGSNPSMILPKAVRSILERHIGLADEAPKVREAEEEEIEAEE